MDNQEIIEEIAHTNDNEYEQYINFTIGDEEFGFEIEYVREVLTFYHVTVIPLVSKVFRGVINIRGSVVPVIDLNYRLYEKETQITNRTRILVTEFEYNEQVIQIGTLVDNVNNVININVNNISKTPEFGINIRDTFIRNICKVSDYFITILNIKEVFNINELSNHEIYNLDFTEGYTKTGQEIELESLAEEVVIDTTENRDQTNHVTFLVHNKIYAISMNRVNEIIELQKIHDISTTTPFLIGVINMRGKIIPIIDMRIKCNVSSTELDKKAAIILTTINQLQTGLLVDKVIDVEPIDMSTVTETISYKEGDKSNYIYGYCNLIDRLVTIINVDNLWSSAEIKEITSKTKTINVSTQPVDETETSEKEETRAIDHPLEEKSLESEIIEENSEISPAEKALNDKQEKELEVDLQKMKQSHDSETDNYQAQDSKPENSDMSDHEEQNSEQVKEEESEF